MAKQESKKVKARVLQDCAFGSHNAVVEVDEQEAKNNAQFLDAHADAVSYAQSLKVKNASNSTTS